ncbi:MAG: hypothetical protein ACTHZH_01275 [Oleiphilaceae bacterium]
MIDLLWTGGWDSTFRLLQLARAGADIQPHYILDQNRSSLKIELQVMNEIRRKVIEKFPHARIREIEMCDQSEIAIFEEYTQARLNLYSREPIGNQYIFIASYCKQKKIKNMELSIEKGIRNRATVMPCLENTEIDQDGRRVMATSVDKDLLCLFSQFSFPILSLTKLDMLDDAKKNDLLDILNMTWFCHLPLFGKPCGKCNPCRSTIEAGHQYRFSALPLARYRFNKIFAPYPKLHQFLGGATSSISSGLRRILSRYPKLYLRIKRFLHGTSDF